MGAGDQALLHTYSAHESHLNHISLSACWISFAPPPEKNTSVFPCVSPPRALSLSGKGLRFLFFVSLAGITPIVAIPLETPPLPHKNKQARTLCPFFYLFFRGPCFSSISSHAPSAHKCLGDCCPPDTTEFGGLGPPSTKEFGGLASPKHNRVWWGWRPPNIKEFGGLVPPKHKRVWGTGVPQAQEKTKKK